MRPILNALLYFPDRTPATTPHDAEDVWVDTRDGERIHGWWFAAAEQPARAHVVFCHGNGGSVADRVPFARLLARAGIDTLLFDYRGYGQSSGRPSEDGTYEDGRAARAAVAARDGVDPERIVLLGESLGGAVALKLAVDDPPAGLVLQSTFTSVRDVAAVHYPFLPKAVVPDAYPSAGLIGRLDAPLLVLHGARDEIVPIGHGRALFDAAPDPKRIEVFERSGHNDVDGGEWIAAIESWVREAVS